MRQLFPATFVTLLALVGGCTELPAGPDGPVTLTFQTPSYPGAGSAVIRAQGTLVMDGRDTITIPGDSLPGVARGTHSLSALLDIAYMPTVMSGFLNPNGTSEQVFVSLPAACRVASLDGRSCGAGNMLQWRGHPRTWCPASDYGDFCSRLPDAAELGASWPADVADNQYLAHAKLLVAATLGADAPAGRAGDTLAMALFRGGDYAPSRRLRPTAADTSRSQGEVMTDMRRVPLGGGTGPALNADDRPGGNFGLAVRTTYSMPATMPNAILIRFDVTNVSASAEYRRVHAEEPVGGHMLHDVYLAPTFDPSLSCGPTGCTVGEERDDNATAFAADSLLVAYDQELLVPEYGGGFGTAPGLLGVRLVSGPPGTAAKAFLFDAGLTPDFITAGLERATYRLLGAGRAGGIAGCVDHAPAAFVCSPETESDIRMGWSVGPIASLAPGATTSVTVAILFASPEAGTFTSGTGVAPGNTSASAFTDTTRPIHAIAARLRALADSTRGAVVNTAP